MINDNQTHRALFTLPPIRPSDETTPAVQSLPVQKYVTGDKELDAVLWLREVIQTGQPGPIAVALEAAKKITTPAKVLEKRYGDHVMRETGSPMHAVFGSFGFANLDGLAKRTLERAATAAEAAARFDGDELWHDTPAEQFCEKALKRCRGFKNYWENDREQVANRFRKHKDLMPHTLADCLHEIAYWRDLYSLRNASSDLCGDGQHEAIAREWFVAGLLSEIRPRSKAEALSVLDYADRSEMNAPELLSITRNLLSILPE